MKKNLIVTIQVYDLNGKPVLVQYTNPSIEGLELYMEHTKRLSGKPSNIIEIRRVKQC